MLLGPGPWAAAHRYRLEQARLAAAAGHARIQMRLGRHAGQIDQLTELTSAHPLEEELWSLLMVALYRSGHRAAALAAFHQASRALRDQLAITPGPRLRHLCQQILRDDPGLGLPPAA